MANYLQIKVEVNSNASWFSELHSKTEAAILQTIKLPTFECILKKAEHRHIISNKIRSWKLNP